MGSGKGGSTQTTSQTNEPPAWALPLLQRAGKDALSLYDQGAGYHTYTGPTQAPLSDATLGGMNGLLAATGSGAPPVTNQSLQAIIGRLKGQMPQVPQAKPDPGPPPPQQSQQLWQTQQAPMVMSEGGWTQNAIPQPDPMQMLRGLLPAGSPLVRGRR
jgi:hypothetical protein